MGLKAGNGGDFCFGASCSNCVCEANHRVLVGRWGHLFGPTCFSPLDERCFEIRGVLTIDLAGTYDNYDMMGLFDVSNFCTLR